MAKRVVAKRNGLSVREQLEASERRDNQQEIGALTKKVNKFEEELAELKRLIERQDELVNDACEEATKWRARADAYLNALIVAGGQAQAMTTGR